MGVSNLSSYNLWIAHRSKPSPYLRPLLLLPNVHTVLPVSNNVPEQVARQLHLPVPFDILFDPRSLDLPIPFSGNQPGLRRRDRDAWVSPRKSQTLRQRPIWWISRCQRRWEPERHSRWQWQVWEYRDADKCRDCGKEGGCGEGDWVYSEDWTAEKEVLRILQFGTTI